MEPAYIAGVIKIVIATMERQNNNSKRSMHSNIHDATIHNNQDMEAT